jgi:MFS family permease
MSELAVPRRNRLLLAQWSELLESDDFRRFWLMRIAGTTAVNALSYALLVFTVRQSESAIATGFLLLTILVPSAVLGAFAGVVVDRLPRGLVLFLSFGLRAVLVFLLMDAKDSLLQLYAVAFGFGIVSQFTVPAEAAVLPQVVRNERLTAANSFINLGLLASQALGMLVLAPLLLKTTNGDPLLVLLMVCFGFAAAMVTIIPQFHFRWREPAESVSVQALRRSFAEGWLTLIRDQVAFLSLTLSVVATTSTLVIAALLPKFATQVLGIAPENIVFVLAPAVLGIFFGLRSVEWLADRFNKLVTISGAYLLMAGSLVALGLVPATARYVYDLNPLGLSEPGPLNIQTSRILATVLYANLYGFAFTVVLTMGRVLLNERIPLNMQGRIFAAQSVLGNMTAIPPVVLASLLADALGVEPVLVFAGLAALVAAAWSRAKASRTVPATPESRNAG